MPAVLSCWIYEGVKLQVNVDRGGGKVVTVREDGKSRSKCKRVKWAE